jgi:hypothetical protein
MNCEGWVECYAVWEFKSVISYNLNQLLVCGVSVFRCFVHGRLFTHYDVVLEW